MTTVEPSRKRTPGTLRSWRPWEPLEPTSEPGGFRMNIKKLVVISAVAGDVLAGASAPAFANSPHFVNASASLNANHELVVSFKEAGLGNEVTNITASASATALWGCINCGQNHPQARN